jgi:hypothetical protein
MGHLHAPAFTVAVGFSGTQVTKVSARLSVPAGSTKMAAVCRSSSIYFAGQDMVIRCVKPKITTD